MDYRNTKLARSFHIGNAHRLSIDLDMPFIRLIDTAHHFDDGRLACTVFTKQNMNFAGFHGDRHVIDHRGVAEYLRHPYQR